MSKEKETEYRTLSVRPAKSVSLASVIVLIFMLAFGVGFAILVGNTLYDNDAPAGVAILFAIFMIGWLGAALVILIYNVRNLRRTKGAPIIEIYVSKDK